MPGHLADDEIAAAAWESFGARLVVARVLTTAHAEPLALLCEAWADYRRKRAEWALMGRKSVIVQSWKDAEGTARTRIIDNPLVKQLRQQSDLVARLAGEFGLTPATASKVTTLDEPDTDPAEAFFNAAPPPNVVAFKRKR